MYYHRHVIIFKTGLSSINDHQIIETLISSSALIWTSQKTKNILKIISCPMGKQIVAILCNTILQWYLNKNSLILSIYFSWEGTLTALRICYFRILSELCFWTKRGLPFLKNCLASMKWGRKSRPLSGDFPILIPLT